MLAGTGFVIRPWKFEDMDALVKHANDAEIARWLQDGFPHPYTREDAQQWLDAMARQAPPRTAYAIEIGGEACGGIGADPLQNVHRKCCSFGYWLARAQWGRGIATAATRLFIPMVFDEFGVERIEAFVYEGNRRSMRVLEKCGFRHEGTARKRCFKNGRLLDEECYALLRQDWLALQQGGN